MPTSNSFILLFLTSYSRDCSYPLSSYPGNNKEAYNLMVSNLVVSISFRVSLSLSTTFMFLSLVATNNPSNISFWLLFRTTLLNLLQP